MRALFFLTTLLASPTWADCPSQADLRHGIRLTDTDGGSEVFQRHDQYFVRVTYDDGDGFGAQYLLLKGIYVVEVFDLENGDSVPGTRITHAYPLKPALAPLPVAGGSWDTEVITLDQGEVLNGAESYRFGAHTQATIGGCSYEMLKITAVYHDDDGYTETLNYLPELGISYLVESREASDPLETYTYTYVRIEAE